MYKQPSDNDHLKQNIICYISGLQFLLIIVNALWLVELECFQKYQQISIFMLTFHFYRPYRCESPDVSPYLFLIAERLHKATLQSL